MNMRRAVILVAVLLSLAVQPPIESSLGRLPTPPVVGMTGGTGAETPAVDEINLTLTKFMITQGALAVVLLVVFWSYRRDFLRKIEQGEKDREVVIGLVKENTTALVTAEQTNARLARAIESKGVV